MQSIRLRALTMAGLASLAMALTACDREGPAERAGERIDNAAERAGNQVERAGDRLQEQARDAKN